MSLHAPLDMPFADELFRATWLHGQVHSSDATFFAFELPMTDVNHDPNNHDARWMRLALLSGKFGLKPGQLHPKLLASPGQVNK